VPDEISVRIEHHFASLTDPRRRKVVYPLINIVTIALCAVIAGADDFVTIAAWDAKSEPGWPRSSTCKTAFPRMIALTRFSRRSIPLSSSVAYSVG